jgi:predicted FMN-binding regulatory protein PaiB
VPGIEVHAGKRVAALHLAGVGCLRVLPKVDMMPEGLDANHIPSELNAERGMLAAHVARANPVWQQCRDGADVMLIFRAGRGGPTDAHP